MHLINRDAWFGPLVCCWAIFLILASLASTLWADGHQISVSASVDSDTVTIGDLITLTVTATYPALLTVRPLSPGDDLGQFEIRDYQIMPDDEGKDGQLRSRYRWVISTFTIGDLEIPPVAVVCADSSGEVDTLVTRAVPIAVISLDPDQAGDIRDIKPPASMSGGRALLYWMAGAAALIAAAIILIGRLRKRRLARDLETIAYQGPPRPADEIALEELERIAALKLLEKGLIKQFYTEIAEVIKRYIARRYHIHTMELTTGELISEMRSAGLPKEHMAAYGPFFNECDLVKFAKHIPPSEKMNRALDEARQLVLSTREEPAIVQQEVLPTVAPTATEGE